MAIDPNTLADLEAQQPKRLPPPSNPMAVARRLAAEQHTHSGGAPTLRAWRGGWWEWRTSHWVELQPAAVRKMAYAYTEHGTCTNAKGEIVPWAPTTRKVSDLLDALAAVCHLPDGAASPGWIDGRRSAMSAVPVIVAAENGLLDVERRELLDHDPGWFNQTSVPFAYDPDTPAPERWLAFLSELWPNDPAAIAALAEWFGYVVSGRTDLHKILLLVGPTRGGKGVIARTCGKLIGRENVAGPTLSSLGGDFGLAPLLGKQLAVISDARLNGRGHHVVVERLLSISGEDWITVNRKYKEQWTGQLPARFMVISNELPQLGDASMAIAGRFVPLLLDRSWLGKEDLGLDRSLDGELPGILNWALDGLARLGERGHFTRPDATDDAIRALQDLASPVAAFVRDRCVRTGEVKVDDLWAQWRSWTEDNGHSKSTKQVFGRDLRAAVPRLRVRRPSDDGDRQRVYVGVSLKDDGHNGSDRGHRVPEPPDEPAVRDVRGPTQCNPNGSDPADELCLGHGLDRDENGVCVACGRPDLRRTS